jgi:hypothetical protein
MVCYSDPTNKCIVTYDIVSTQNPSANKAAGDHKLFSLLDGLYGAKINVTVDETKHEGVLVAMDDDSGKAPNNPNVG